MKPNRRQVVVSLTVRRGQRLHHSVSLGEQQGYFLSLVLFWSGLVCSILSLCSGRKKRKKNSVLSRDCLLGSQSERTPETGLQMERWAATSAWWSAEHQWLCAELREDTGIPCGAWGTGRSLGKLVRGAWVAECKVKRSRSGACSSDSWREQSRAELNWTERKTFQHQPDWTATLSLNCGSVDKTQQNTLSSSWFWSGHSLVWRAKTSTSNAKCESCTEVTAQAPRLRQR